MCVYDVRDDIYVSNDISRTGSYEPGLVSYMLKTLSKHPNARLLDIGGNIGYFTLAAASMGHKVDVFEPVPTNVAMIQQSLHRNNIATVSVYATSLGDGTKNNVRIGLSSNNQGGVQHSQNSLSSIVVTQFALDSILKTTEDPVFLKMDIEGGECDATLGMKNYLQNSRIIGVSMEFFNLNTAARGG